MKIFRKKYQREIINYDTLKTSNAELLEEKIPKVFFAIYFCSYGFCEISHRFAFFRLIHFPEKKLNFAKKLLTVMHLLMSKNVLRELYASYNQIEDVLELTDLTQISVIDLER